MNLDTLSLPPAAHGDYGIHQPENAWPGAGDDIVVNMRLIGDLVIQSGFSLDSPSDVWQRSHAGGAAWSAWSQTVGAPPVISNLVPAGGTAGDGNTLIHVYGAGFVSGAQVFSKTTGTGDTPAAETTTFVSAQHLSFTASAAKIVVPGLDLHVRNPNADQSNVVAWTVTAP